MEHYKNELKLTLENTEKLYKKALAITDFDWQGEQIGDLYRDTWLQTTENAGRNIAPTLYTDHDVREVMDIIVTTTKNLQLEARP